LDEKMDLETTLRRAALATGVNYFGIADLAPGRDLILEEGGEMMARFPKALSLGIVMPFAIVDQLPRHQEKAVALAYRSHSYTLLNSRLDDAASRLASLVQQRGFRAFPIAASLTIDEDRHYGHFSHKLAAHLAGLGWIGKSCLLVTPEVGPRVRWATVLTNAPLPSGEPLEQRCGDCQVCVDACPVGAFTGRNFDPLERRELRFDVRKCDAYLDRHLHIPDQDVSVCGMCVYSCPYGQKGFGLDRSAS
jgi:epoxyqueuosine reductase